MFLTLSKGMIEASYGSETVLDMRTRTITLIVAVLGRNSLICEVINIGIEGLECPNSSRGVKETVAKINIVTV